jgi:hypothetical protein
MGTSSTVAARNQVFVLPFNVKSGFHSGVLPKTRFSFWHFRPSGSQIFKNETAFHKLDGGFETETAISSTSRGTVAALMLLATP